MLGILAHRHLPSPLLAGAPCYLDALSRMTRACTTVPLYGKTVPLYGKNIKLLSHFHFARLAVTAPPKGMGGLSSAVAVTPPAVAYWDPGEVGAHNLLFPQPALADSLCESVV